MQYLSVFSMLLLIVLSPAFAQSYPKGEIGAMIQLGEEIIKNTDTHPLTKKYVNNTLRCSSCHLSGSDGHAGTSTGIGSFNAIAASYPKYKAREAVVETLQDRIDNCFLRSMDGVRPVTDTKASIAMLSYITWLAEGKSIAITKPSRNDEQRAALLKKFAAIQKKATHQNYVKGQKLFAQQCASCHGNNGEGMANFPPLWGKDKSGKWRSYNAGAGMSQLDKSAMWIQSNMPLGAGNTLGDQDAADIAIFINAQERNTFDLAKKLQQTKELGYYNSHITKEVDTVESNFKKFGLSLKTITQP